MKLSMSLESYLEINPLRWSRAIGMRILGVSAFVALILSGTQVLCTQFLYGNPVCSVIAQAAAVFLASSVVAVVLSRLVAGETVTAQKDSNDSRANQSQENLQELERLVAAGETTNSILHDINNGLSVLAHNPSRIRQLIGNEPGIRSETRETIGKILETHERIVQMMGKLISTQQAIAMNRGKRTSFSLAEVMNEVLEVEGVRLARAGVSIHRSDLKDFSLHGYRELFMSILMNVLKNAREALVIGDPLFKSVEMRSRLEGSMVVLEIVDNGCGICPNQLAKIGKHGFTTKTGGQGLGLFGSQRMLQDMNGWIQVSSDGLGLGSKVTIGLPGSPSARSTDAHSV